MTTDAQGQIHIPGLITPSGTTVPALPATAQPGGNPIGTVSPGQLPTPQFAAPHQTGPALPQAGGAVLPPPPQVDPAALAAYLAAQQAQQQPAPQPVPQIPAAPQQQPTPVLPMSVPGLQPAAIPGMTTTLQLPAQPAQQPVAQPTAPVAAQPAATTTPPATDGPNGLDDGDGGKYPEGKPVNEMTDGERANYYKWYSRQWENRAKSRSDYDAVKAKAEQFDQLSAANQTEVEQRIAAARTEGWQQASAAAAVVLVDAHVRAGLQTRLQPHQVEALAATLNHQHFLSADGRSVDAAKVATFVDTVAPSATTPAPPATAVPAATAPTAPAAPGALPTGLPTPGQPGQPATGLPRTIPDLGQGSQSQTPLDKLALGKQQAQAFLAGNY